MKLTKVQEYALQQVSETEWKSAYGMGRAVGLNTLYALERRGLIKRRTVGAVAWTGWERTSYEWIRIKQETSQ